MVPDMHKLCCAQYSGIHPKYDKEADYETGRYAYACCFPSGKTWYR